MSRFQRRLLAVVASLTVVVATAAAFAADRDPGSSRATIIASGSRAEAADAQPPDLAAVAPVHGGTPLPTTAPPPTEAPSTTAAPTTTTAPPRALSPSGTAFGPASDTAVRAYAAGQDCTAAAAPGWTARQCGVASSATGPTAWVIESKAKALRAVLLRSSGPGQWTPFLAASDDLGSRWSDIKARLSDGPNGSSDQLVGFGFHTKEGTLSVDIVRDQGVAAHADLGKGAARLPKAALDTWSLQGDGKYLHQTVRWREGAWRVVATETVSPGLVPPSHL